MARSRTESRRGCWAVAFSVAWGLTGAVSAIDCDRDGVDDAEEIASGDAEDCNENGIPDGCEVFRTIFGAGPSFVLEGFAEALATGDFDGDGRTDLATGATEGPPGVEVALARGDAAGVASFERRSLPIEHGVRTIAAGDVDGDGDLDVVAADGDRWTLLRGDGHGVFVPDAPVAFPALATELSLADLDADGRLDALLTHEQGDIVRVLWTVSDGDAAESTTLPVGDTPTGTASGDIDGDGRLDIVTANRRSRDLSLLVQTGPREFRRADLPSESRLRPARPFLGDLDGDGDLDLAVMTISTVEFWSGEGNGTFVHYASFLQSFVNGLFLDDVDRDGDQDLVAATSNQAIVAIVARGDGTFQTSYGIGLDGSVTQLAVGDFDGDGRRDFAGLQTSIAGEPRAVSVLLSAAATRSLPPYDARVLSLSEPHWGVLGDFDDDGDLDFASPERAPGRVDIVLNDGQGGFALDSQLFPGGSLITISGGDFDGDGDFDLVAPDQEGSSLVILESDRGRFQPVERIRVGAQPNLVRVVDLDGDERPDLVSANLTSGDVSIVRGTGGRFSLVGSVRVGPEPLGVTSGDFDGDGAIDLAVACRGSSEVVVLRSDDGFSNPGGAGIRRYDVDRPAFVEAADVDGDGHVDLVTAGPRSVAVQWNDGFGRFESPEEIRLPVQPYSLVVADVDEDGRLDIAAISEEQSMAAILLQDASRRFGAPHRLRTGAGPRWIGAADLDGDGDTDLVSADRGSSTVTMLFRAVAGRAAGWLGRLCTPFDWNSVALAVGETSDDGAVLEGIVKFVVPSDPDPDRIGPAFQDTSRYQLHEEFLRAAFPERFGAMSPLEYDRLVGRRATREYFVGVLRRIVDREGRATHGFSVLASYFDDPAELPTPNEVRRVYETLGGVFTLGELAYLPEDRVAREDAAGWNVEFPVVLRDVESSVPFRAYTRGVAYGRVRVLDDDAFRALERQGGVSFQDILVLASAPRDIEGVVAAVITGAPQGELGHLAVRTARRGSPNAYVADALGRFAEHDGALVRLEVDETGFRISAATADEAERFREENRPRLSVQPSFDPDFSLLSSLEDIARLDATAGEPPAESRFGGKAAHLARLQTVLTGEWSRYRADGFAVPVRAYLEFMDANRMPSLLDPSREVTYTDAVRELLGSPEFESDPRLRYELLARLRDHMEDDSGVDPALVRAVAVRIATTFGDTSSPVRFRSSSNVEDALEFSGAGLYSSTSACAADDLDQDPVGPSRCGDDRDERGIARALRRVWASLWNFRAYEERAYWGIAQEDAAMGVLVSRAFRDEGANGVAFTGNPFDPFDRRYLVTSQVGEASVVSPEPGVLAESTLLSMELGRVVDIGRVGRSTLVGRNDVVLDDDRLQELGALLWHIDESMPVDAGAFRREQVLFDTEFKVDAEGRLAIKQVRPFLLSGDPPPAPRFELEIPAGAAACATFVPFRSAEEVLELKARIAFRPGRYVLDTRHTVAELDLIEEVHVGPTARAARSVGPGRLELRRTPRPDGRTTYRFDYRQDYELDDGQPWSLVLFDLRYDAVGDEPLEPVVVFDEEYITRRLSLEASSTAFVPFGSCTNELLPRFRIEVDLEGGTRLVLEERFEEAASITETGPASLISARIDFSTGESRSVSDYWHLVYTAQRHNLQATYWTILDPPVDAGLDRPVAIVELRDAFPALPVRKSVRFLDASYEAIATAVIARFSKEEWGPAAFVRGDVDASGAVDLTDAVAILASLFQGAGAMACEKAADANDDGRLDLSDAIAVLRHLFLGGAAPPAPHPECGDDLTDDTLACATSAACGA